jgi:hypothetical protein
MLLASSTKPEREGEDKGNKEERGAQTERQRKNQNKEKGRKKTQRMANYKSMVFGGQCGL